MKSTRKPTGLHWWTETWDKRGQMIQEYCQHMKGDMDIPEMAFYTAQDNRDLQYSSTQYKVDEVRAMCEAVQVPSFVPDWVIGVYKAAYKGGRTSYPIRHYYHMLVQAYNVIQLGIR